MTGQAKIIESRKRSTIQDANSTDLNPSPKSTIFSGTLINIPPPAAVFPALECRKKSGTAQRIDLIQRYLPVSGAAPIIRLAGDRPQLPAPGKRHQKSTGFLQNHSSGPASISFETPSEPTIKMHSNLGTASRHDQKITIVSCGLDHGFDAPACCIERSRVDDD